jgi:hypothetical protein
MAIGSSRICGHSARQSRGGLVFFARNPGTMAVRAIARLHVRPLLVEPFTLGRVAALFQEVLDDFA